MGGITAILRPVTDADSGEWIWWATGTVTESIVGSTDSVQQTQRVLIDNKAMRKVGQNQVLIGVVEAISGAGQNLDSSIGTRILFKR